MPPPCSSTSSRTTPSWKAPGHPVDEDFPTTDALYDAAVGAAADDLVDSMLRAYSRAQNLLARERTRARYAAVFEHARLRPAGMRLLLLASRDAVLDPDAVELLTELTLGGLAHCDSRLLHAAAHVAGQPHRHSLRSDQPRDQRTTIMLDAFAAA